MRGDVVREFLLRLRDAWRVVLGTRHAVDPDRLTAVAVWLVYDLMYPWRELVPPLDDAAEDLERRKAMIGLLRDKLPAYLLPREEPIPF